MNRRGFLQLLALGVGAPAAVAAAGPAVKSADTEWGLFRHPFVKNGAIRGRCATDLHEAALEDAIVALAMAQAPHGVPYWPHSRYMIVVPKQQYLQAAKVVEALPKTEIKVEFRLESSFSNCDEWGLIAGDGRCFYSPGAV